jgi:hypothetical protein
MRPFASFATRKRHTGIPVAQVLLPANSSALAAGWRTSPRVVKLTTIKRAQSAPSALKDGIGRIGVFGVTAHVF